MAQTSSPSSLPSGQGFSPRMPRFGRWTGSRLHLGMSTGDTDLLNHADAFPMDETAEFHDPYSDLNLFLSQNIKKQMRQDGIVQKWSSKIQDALLSAIAPEFQKKFPKYRLGVAALRKTWEKVAYYAQQMEGKKDAVGDDGQLNISFLIRENLRHYPSVHTISGFQPYHYAHQLALKISECVAIVDGITPSMEGLVCTIWAMQRHLLSWGTLQTAKSPYEEYGRLDQLIVKTMLDPSVMAPVSDWTQREMQVTESLRALCELPEFASQDVMVSNISAIVAEKLYPFLHLYRRFSVPEQQAIIQFLKRHIALGQLSSPGAELNEIVRRMMSLYVLAVQIPKDIGEVDVIAAIDVVCEMRPQTGVEICQALKAFIAAEIVLLKGQRFENDKGQVGAEVLIAYRQIRALPVVMPEELQTLEVLFWKYLSSQPGLLEKLPYCIGQRIESEVVWQLIDHPHEGFSSLVHRTVRCFQKNREIAATQQQEDMKRKIRLWCQQADLVYRCVQLDQDTLLLALIVEVYKEHDDASHMILVSEVCQRYLRRFPDLGDYASQLAQRVWTLYKYCWYTCFSAQEETAIDRYVQWCVREDDSTGHLARIKGLFAQHLPLIPFVPTAIVPGLRRVS